MLELYHGGHSTCSKQVRLCLAEKNLEYVSRYLELWSFENLAPSYLELNPYGVVPTLVHDGIPIINSFCIMEYLEDVFPLTPLRPAEPVLRARQRLWSWNADELHPVMADLSHHFGGFGKRMNMDERAVAQVAEMTPAPDRRARFLRNASQNYPNQLLAQAIDRVSFIFGELNEALMDGPWIVGEQFTLADVSMLALVDRGYELKLPELPPDKWPHLLAWHAACLERPAVAKTYARSNAEVPSRPQTIELRVSN